MKFFIVPKPSIIVLCISISLVILHPLTLAAEKQIEPIQSAIKKIDADIIFMRHANAPGFGDPNNFKIGDCSTQRNLDKTGRVQAQLTGKYLRTIGLEFDEVLSSEWCRCRETAALLDIGNWELFSGLNSFFQGHADKQETLTKLERYLSKNYNRLTLLVTHQVVIRAITDHSVGSGDLVVYNSNTQKALPIGMDGND